MPQKILRIFTIIVIGITSFGLLVGGSFFYKHYIYTNPLEEALNEIQTLEISEFEQREKSLFITVHFNSKEGLQPSFYHLINQIQEQNNNSLENCVVKIKNNSNNEELVKFLKEAKFPIYEAMNTGNYTALPQQLSSLSLEDEITFALEMDDQYIFVTANKGEEFAHLVINDGDVPYRVITTMGEKYL